MIYSYGFKGLSIHIARLNIVREGLEGGAYLRDKKTVQELKNRKGAHTQGHIYGTLW